VVAAALRVMPFSTVRSTAARVRSRVTRFVPGTDERVIWAIQSSGRRLGRLSTCLVRALVAELVIRRDDIVLMIGIRRPSADSLEAHAWLASGDRVLMGATSVNYVRLAALKSLSAEAKEPARGAARDAV
jgi:transglutaminase superfamily protein